ncbi:MAG: transglutaminase domain-containing protein [Thermodesulfovibrionia bacterium]|nr:transglutaminase domain-containing protein [Thermodesulfovibrionia bacterium]
MNRRKFIKLSALTAGAVIGGQLLPDYTKFAMAGNPADLKGAISDTKVKSLDIEVIFDTEIITPPKHNKPVSIWMPLSKSCFEQDVSHLSIDSPVAFHINEDRHYGNKGVFIGPVHLKNGDKLTVMYKIHRKAINIIEDKDEDIKKHLVLTEKEELDKNIKKFTDDIVSTEKDPFKVGKKIYYALMNFLTYDRDTIGCGPGVSVWTFENRGGRCADFQALFRSMMIYKGIPVRWEQGILIPYPSEKIWVGELEGDCIGTLCWTKFYIGDGKWVPVDLVEGYQRKDMRDYFFGHLSPNRFNISTGRDITLNPPQEGEVLNTFPVTYGEFDGIPLIYGHHYRNNVGYKVLGVEV